MVVAQALGLEAFLVRSNDRDHRNLLGESNVLEPVDNGSDLLGLGVRLRVHRDLLHVVHDHEQPPVIRQGAVLLDQLADVVDGAGRL